MESQYQKWVNLSYLALAALVGYVVFALAAKFAGAYDLEARVRNIDLILRGVSFVIGGILFFVLYRHEQANQFMNEVMVELSRVTWPTQKETTSATLVVIVMVIVSGLILGLLDYFWTTLLKWVL
ncbi:MAG: preprotein translocase subunit SecE [Oligoflexia bacterium]|nr:preprotein translocase subunit SecE [Oligoflexia bacterium]